MLQLSDQKVWEASKLLYDFFKKDDENRRLDTDNLKAFKKQNIKPLYPHHLSEDGEITKYGCGEACCEVDPGRYCCCKATLPDSAFQKLGLGLCLYFKFIKHACVIFMIVAILTLGTCLVCYLVANQNSFNPTSDYQTFLFSTTLGTFSSQHMKCQYTKNQNGAITFNLKCPYGRLNYFGPTYSSQTLNNLYNCKNEIRTYKTAPNLAHSGITSTCSSSSSCSLTFTPTTFQASYLAIAFSYECLDQTYSYGSYSLKSQYLLYIVVGVDVLCCLILTLFYCSQSKAEEEEIDYFKQQQLSLNDFSIKIKGLNLGTFNEEFNSIINGLTQRLGRDSIHQFVQVKAPDRIDFVEYQNKKNEAYQKLYEFVAQEFFDIQSNPNQFPNHQKFIDNNFSEGKYAKFKQNLTKLVSQYHFLEYDPNEQKINKSCSIFLVVNNVKLKRQIFQMQQNGCCSKHYTINGKQYKLSEPPAPDLIIWKNKGKWTFIRVLISWILTLCICFGSYMLFGYLQSKQNQLLSNYNFSINCAVFNYTPLQMTVYSPPVSDTNYHSCFCKTNLLDLSYTVCNDYRTTYFTYTAIPIIISIFLVIYNVIVAKLFKLLSKFESHRLIADELYSFTIKRSFMLIMNMALIMIILNMKFTASVDMTQVGFLLQGRYHDLTPDWYNNIGTVIILTMIFNISFPIIELLVATITKCIKNCWDRKCCFRKTSCKTKSEYIELFSSDIYPIEERYACLISIFIITLVFSCIIPILNLICALSLLLLYFSDRVLVFKIYQTPVNYGAQLHKLIMKVMYVGLIAHFVLTAFFLSETELIAPYSSIPEQYRLDSGNQRINSIISTFYIIPYIVFTGLFVGWSIFKNTLIALCSKCCQLMCKKDGQEEIVSKYKIDQSFYDSLSLYQLSRLKMVIQAQINKLAVKNHSFHTMANNSSSMNETMKELSSKQLNLSVVASNSEHESLLRRTLTRLQAWESLRKKQSREGAHLIGLPSYEIMISDQAFEQDKKNNQLSQSLIHLVSRPTHNFTE